MNNQQAINLLKGLEKNLDDYCELNDEGKTAFGMAITALELFGNSKQLPSIQPDTTTHDSIPAKTGKNDGDRTSGDCISRTQAIDTIKEIYEWHDSVTKERIIEHFKQLPSAQPERKTGHWIEHENADIVDGHYVPKYECSCCHTWKHDDSDYCPDCGMKMCGTVMEGGEQE